MRLEIVPFQENHLAPAAGLVARRYQALRSRLSALPPQYEEGQVIQEMLGDLAAEADGMAALQDGRLAGFMIGILLPEFMGRRSAYSPAWANAAQLSHSRRIYEELYAPLSERWVADGCYAHYVSLKVHDRQALEAFSWLGFGLVNVDSVRSLAPLESGTVEVEVRQAGPAEAGELSELGKALLQHVAAPPTFWLHELPDFGERLSEPGYTAWLAYQAGQAVGFIALEPGEDCDCALLSDEKTVNICGAFTREAARGQGVASALLGRALDWARTQGYERCAVDFESANSLAARFWPRWFEPVSYSLRRGIDERITVSPPRSTS